MKYKDSERCLEKLRFGKIIDLYTQTHVHKHPDMAVGFYGTSFMFWLPFGEIWNDVLLSHSHHYSCPTTLFLSTYGL